MQSLSTFKLLLRTLLATSLGLSEFGAMAATPPAPVTTEVQSRFEQERARCLAGQSGQALETCLKEAGAARDAARQGQLDDAGAKYRKNAKDRCEALAGDQRRDCLSRMKGAANTTESGSVKGGGIIRETVTREPAAVPVPASAASTN